VIQKKGVAMTSDKVREFVDHLHSEMDQCDDAFGTHCDTVDISLGHYAHCCCQYNMKVASWARGIFSGESECDSDVEQLLRTEGERLLARAKQKCQLGAMLESECFGLPGLRALQSALWELEQSVRNWVTPKLAVNPLARRTHKFDAATEETIKQRVKSLPQLPANWEKAFSKSSV
jgi:hypothetical protein